MRDLCWVWAGLKPLQMRCHGLCEPSNRFVCFVVGCSHQLRACRPSCKAPDADYADRRCLIAQHSDLRHQCRIVAHGTGAAVLWRALLALDWSCVPTRCVALAPSTRFVAADALAAHACNPWRTCRSAVAHMVHSARPPWLRVGLFREPDRRDDSWAELSGVTSFSLVEHMASHVPAASSVMCVTTPVTAPPQPGTGEDCDSGSGAELEDTKGLVAIPYGETAGGCGCELTMLWDPRVLAACRGYLSNGVVPTLPRWS